MRATTRSTETTEHAHTHALNRFAVIPTAERLNADTARAGRGVTIALLDSGFYPHPDLTEPRDRILAYHDVTDATATLNNQPQSWDWHGTQTAVVAAGNGRLSDGVYRGLASEADLVLVKVSHRGRISDENIARGIEWVIANKDRYNIRVVSLSLGGDADVSFKESAVDEAAERAVGAGLTLVVAAGNAGCTTDHRPIPPANAPSVITVGGYNDDNRIENNHPSPYCSSFGPTVDGLIKPEIVAPAIWVAAPILPNTEPYRRAEAWSRIAAAPDYLIHKQAQEVCEEAGLARSIVGASADEIRAEVEAQLRAGKIVATHYQHVDGTSFAAPIVASVAARMLEANPALTPAVIKNILISTADRAAGLSLAQQGYGVLNARRAVEEAAREDHASNHREFAPPQAQGDRLVFWFHHDAAQSVSLAGDFNGWNPASAPCARQANGMWRVEIGPLAAGSYQYKFVVNHARWLDDPSNGLKTTDGHGGFNSVLLIAGQSPEKEGIKWPASILTTLTK